MLHSVRAGRRAARLALGGVVTSDRSKEFARAYLGGWFTGAGMMLATILALRLVGAL